MNRQVRRLLPLLSLWILVLGVTDLRAEINAAAGTSGFAFLKIKVGARPVAMGGAFTGLADDEASLYYNPAGIASFEDKRYMVGYHSYFLDMQSGFVGFVKPIGYDHAMALHVTYLNYGDFVQADRDGQVGETFGGGDFMLAGTFATRRSPKLSLGVTAKFIYEKIQNFSATGLAFDLGVKYTTDRGYYGAGLMLQNLGTQLSSLGAVKDDLPTTLRFGVSGQPRGLYTRVVADLIAPFDNDVAVAVGAEYFNLKPLYLRMGWNSFGANYRTDDSEDGLAGLSVGLGVDYRRMQFSYAYMPAADLGESHRITLTGGIY